MRISTLLRPHRDEPRVLLAQALQRAWRHHALIVPLYRALATQTPDEISEIVLLRLAQHEEEHLRMYAGRLVRMRCPVPQNTGVLAGVWHWLLVCSGMRLALAWADWVERRDSARIVTMMQKIAARRARGTSVNEVQR
jgi:hypothetical protein